MSKLKVKSGKGQLILTKSKRLVGLKPTADKDFEQKSYVKEQIYNNLGGFKIVTLERAQNTSLDNRLDEVRRQKDIEVGTHVYHAEGSNKALVPTGEIYIIFQDDTSAEEQKIALSEFSLELVERREKNKVIVKVTSNSPNPLKTAALLQQSSLVKIAEPDIDALVDEYDFKLPADTLLQYQWQFKNSGVIADTNRKIKPGADSRIVDAWTRLGNLGSDKIVIAVVDNGFDLGHPDLKDKIYKPFDLWNQSPALQSGDPRFTHGTPCASVALATANGSGIVGAAPKAKFMPVSGTSFSLRATEEMFNYCLQQKADVISCSWGSTDPAFTLNPMKEEAIGRAAREGRNGKGCVIIYAVGNEDLDFVSFYSAHPDVIAVAASTSMDEHASYSNRGREVSICAPSNGDWPIIAARAWWDEGISWENGEKRFWADGISRGDRYKHFGGTSAACPLVAGVCALMLSANPELTAKQVKEILQSTADKIGLPTEYVNGHSRKYGYGRVNADKAVAEAIRRKDSSSSPAAEVSDGITSGQGIFRFSVEKQQAKGFGVQIGAFAEYGNVLIQAERLQRLFAVPVIVSINELNGKTVYKIVAGAFSSDAAAKELLVKMKAKGVDGFVRNLKDL